MLYPYVYLLARSAFLAQSRTLVEAARGLGLSGRAALLRVAVPLARPAIFGGVALALMEALADFGTVNLLGVHTFTDAIYRVWFLGFDRDAAMQLATLLVSITLTLLALERLARGRAAYHQAAAGGEALEPVRLRGLAAAAAVAGPLALVGFVVGAPLAQLAVWALDAVSDDLLPAEFWRGGAQQPAARLRRGSADRGVRHAARLRPARLPEPGQLRLRFGWRRSATDCPAPWWPSR